MSAEDDAAARAAKDEAAARMTASLRYLMKKYGHLAGLTGQATAQMRELARAWQQPWSGPGPGGSGTPGGNGPDSSPGGSGSGLVPGVPGGSSSSSSSGYASGGLVISSGLRYSNPVASPGFDGGGPPVVAGSVTGYRWWTIASPDLNMSPAHADVQWDPDRVTTRLRGAWADWQPGVNHAACLAGPRTGALRDAHDQDSVPERSCGCGFWAYWGVQRHELGRAGSLPVFGVIKGYGKTLAGPHGFRCAKARILAVHLPLTIGDPELIYAERLRDIEARRVHNHPQFTGKVITIGDARVPWPLQHRDLPEPPAEDEIARAREKGEAWAAVIGDRIGQMYPGTEVCETRDHLLAKYPPDKVYGNR